MFYCADHILNEIGKSPTVHLGVLDQCRKPSKIDKKKKTFKTISTTINTQRPINTITFTAFCTFLHCRVGLLHFITSKHRKSVQPSNSSPVFDSGHLPPPGGFFGHLTV